MIQETYLTKTFGIKYPIIMAPMFLVSNTEMIIAALENGITAAIPALNFRTEKELRTAIQDIKKHTSKPFGLNIIANKSNPKQNKQLQIALDENIAFIITSLGNPKEIIKQCKPKGIKVFCDVIDVQTAKKVEQLGADGIIAVNKSAGGHSGKLSIDELLTSLNKECKIPIISAGGVATKEQLKNILAKNVAGVSIGTAFIASHECNVSQEYKDAIINYGANDIVKTNKMSGSALSVINTEFVKQIGTKANIIERIMNKNKRLKKYAKMFLFKKGMSKLQKSAYGATYKTVWVAGPSIEYINQIKSTKQIIESLTEDYS